MRRQPEREVVFFMAKITIDFDTEDYNSIRSVMKMIFPLFQSTFSTKDVKLVIEDKPND